MDDLISRQAAIDALAKNMPSWTTPDGSGQFDHDIQVTDEAYVDCMQIIHDMPSAQPDIIQCRNCKFASGDSRICMKFGHSPIGELYFCAWAERRTDGRD